MVERAQGAGQSPGPGFGYGAVVPCEAAVLTREAAVLTREALVALVLEFQLVLEPVLVVAETIPLNVAVCAVCEMVEGPFFEEVPA